jgi:hypothetical protein
MSISHVQRTLKEQRKLGRLVDICERFVHNKHVPPGFRSDLFGLFDLIALSQNQGIIGIQVCGLDYAAHYRKITDQNSDNAIAWLVAGRGRSHIEIWAWRKILKKRGGKLRIWSPRIKSITHKDFTGKYTFEAA